VKTVKGNIMVYVLDREGRPLMPTERTAWVAYALKHGEAKVVRREPFTIQLLRDSTKYLQAVTLGVDVGSKHIGLCASTEAKELYSAQVEQRDDVSELLTARREFRRGRRGRSHNWYRPARWRNRANTREGHLPPSIRHKADSHIRAIKFVCKMLPVARIRLEIGKFDSQKIANPKIQGEEYQQGALANWENLKAYAKWRDGYKCRACGKSKHKDGVRLEVHHIRRKSDGGTDTPDNVVTLCDACHKAHHQGERKLKFSRPPEHKGEAHMNAMKDYLCDEVHGLYGERFDGVTYGYITAIARREHGIEKTHANDAFCIVGNIGAKRNDYNRYLHRFVRRHNRMLYRATMMKGGIRKSAQTARVVRGFRHLDEAKWNGMLCWVSSRRTNGSFKAVDVDGSCIKDGINWKRFQRLRNTGTVLTKRLDGDIKRISIKSNDLIGETNNK